ncbi:8551_t:CDS:2 [Funneliformis mosseae]|uniref:8551_t:CDS:1 n=1 Tax=Funneliformis mosseae TaxID=27381 RepID=A0A9N9CDB1_FUNMO|nr:8551_t:CDS:2 [Funneliformis mosseae]
MPPLLSLLFLTRLYFFLLTLIIICCSLIESLRKINKVYGKLEDTISHKTWLTSKLSVPKYYFRYFYITGFLWISYIIIEIILFKNNFIGIFSIFVHLFENTNNEEIYKEYYGKQPVEECILALFMMEVQTIRRAYECFFVEKPSPNSKMLITHHIVGMTFYLATGLAVFIEGLWNLGVFNKDQFTSLPPLTNFIKWNTMIALSLFIYASYHQNVLHNHLASLRPSNTSNTSYVPIYLIPKGDWFEYISSAHYFAEILIYVSFVILTRGMNLTVWLVLIWTIIGLSTIARESDLWGKEKFGEKWPNRWLIIPFIY